MVHKQSVVSMAHVVRFSSKILVAQLIDYLNFSFNKKFNFPLCNPLSRFPFSLPLFFEKEVGFYSAKYLKETPTTCIFVYEG